MLSIFSVFSPSLDVSENRTPQKGRKVQFVSTTPHRLRKRLSAPSLRSDSDSELSPSDSGEEEDDEDDKGKREEDRVNQSSTPSKPSATALYKTPAKKSKTAPEPPCQVSHPDPPCQVNHPDPPCQVSHPDPPCQVSHPEPPCQVSLFSLFFSLINLHTNNNITFIYVFRPFTRYFVEAPLAPRVFLGTTLQAWHTCFWGVSPILLCRSSQALLGWMGSFAAQLFSGLSRDVRSGSSPGSGWATQGHSETCPATTPALFWLCA
ncbi:unnamed protein product [Oncorhynchus mykiss]|uniref:Uncharacterized protein n=1 Tax=Oncorhynchus mykiss TaxID=8022 RepID=A0A060YYT7_ONCMY|nr:unnamed protein product [Oncorhynchus mykiss]